MKKNSITKKDLSIALSRLIESSGQEEKSGVDLSDDAEIKMIVNKYKETEYFKDLNELMSIVIHKVQNPLAGISAAVEVLRERVEKNDANDKLFEMIFKEIDRLKYMAKDLFRTFST